MDVQGMMQARDERAARQVALLNDFGLPLISFTLNIPGPQKTNAQIEQAFALSARALTDALSAHGLPLVHSETHSKKSGPEGFFVVDGESARIKGLCVQLEDRDDLGRLLDLDVLEVSGHKLSRLELGLPGRGCLACGKPGAYCAASRAHGVQELFGIAMGRIQEALGKEIDTRIATLATQALLQELAITPKPGLVDRNNTGAHTDMDCHTFMASAAALQPYFAACAYLGRHRGANARCFAALRLEGAIAEGKMLRATQGVNTHKGAIFTLGILAASAGHLLGQGQAISTDGLAQAATGMTAQALEEERQSLGQARTYGEGLMRTRLSGARAEAAAGFPTVLRLGLPTLEAGLAEGLPMDEAGARTLLAIMLSAEDTVLLRRAKEQGAGEALAMVRDVLDAGAPIERLLALDQHFIQQGLSPGGSADLLAATLFVRLLMAEQMV